MSENQNQQKRRKAGFTLVELLVVIAIIGILATIVGFNMGTAMDDAAISQAQAQIKNFETALTAYRLRYNRYPTTAEGLQALINNDRGIRFLDAREIPMDPWGRPYVYTSDTSRTYKIISYGADGRPGGTGPDAEISSEQ